MSGSISIYIQKNGAGIWLDLPSDRDEFQKAMNEIGAPASSDMAVSQYKADLTSLPAEMLVNADLNTVNYLAARLSSLTPGHKKLLEAILDSPLRSIVFRGIEQLIDFARNTGVFELYHNVHGPEDLARYYINKSGLIQMPPEWAEGIELKRFGENLEKHEPGYYTRHGYLIGTGLDWTQDFAQNGKVPAEYRIFSIAEKT